MSFVDTFEHYHVGFIFGIPLYLPEKKSSSFSENKDFPLNKNTFLIGGGSGEREMIIVNIDDSVKLYLNLHLQANKKLKISDDFFKYDSNSEDLRSDFIKLSQEANYPFIPENTEFVEDKSENVFEKWLAIQIGYFVYHCMPEIMEGERFSFIKNFRDKISDEDIIHFETINICTLPFNHPMLWGRKTVGDSAVFKNPYIFS